MFSGFDMSFRIMSALFPIIVTLVFGILLVSIISGIRQWYRNNEAALLRVEAVVVSKRTSVTHHHHNDVNMGMHMMVDTNYYVTFETDSGARMEFHVSGREYGMLAKGDRGKLTFQGTRYKGFERW